MQNIITPPVCWPNHEVSLYHVVDWEGWRPLEWDLNDPEQVGSWIGHPLLDRSVYRIDSFYFSYDEANGDQAGQIYLDELQVVKKMAGVSIDPEANVHLPSEVSLYQNYPNPFNPETVIDFDQPANMEAKVFVFNNGGKELEVLMNTQLTADRHTVNFNGSDYAAGVYMLVLECKSGTKAIQILLLK